MTLTIDLPDEQSAALAAKARARGLSAEQYARQVLENDIAPEWLQKSWESSRQAGLDQLSGEEIDVEIAAARKARREAPPQPGERKRVRVEKDAEFEPLLDACEAANLLRIHPKTIQRFARGGYVSAFRVGKFWRYRASDLEKWLRSGSRFSGQPADRMDFTKEKS